MNCGDTDNGKFTTSAIFKYPLWQRCACPSVPATTNTHHLNLASHKSETSLALNTSFLLLPSSGTLLPSAFCDPGHTKEHTEERSHIATLFVPGCFHPAQCFGGEGPLHLVACVRTEYPVDRPSLTSFLRAVLTSDHFSG